MQYQNNSKSLQKLTLASLIALSAWGCSGKAKEAVSARSPLVPAVAVENFPIDDLPFASVEGSDDLTLEFRDVSTFVWPDPLNPEVGSKVLSLSRVRDENFEEKFANEVKIDELDAKVKNGSPALIELRKFFDEQILAQETKVSEQRGYALPTAVKNYTRQLVDKGELPRILETLGELIDAFNNESDTITPRTQAVLGVITNPGARKNLEGKLNAVLKSRSELKATTQQLRERALAAGFAADLESDFRITDAEILKLKNRNDSPREGKVWSKWSLAQQNQRITEVIPHLVGLQAELISYPEVTFTKNKNTGGLGIKITKFNPCFSGAEFANDLEFSATKNNLTDVKYETRGGILSFNFNYEGPGNIEKEIPAYEVKPVTDEAGQTFTDRKGNLLIDFFPVLRPVVSSEEGVEPGFEQVKRNVKIQCFGGSGEVKIKRVRYAVKNQIIFQGDLTLTDKSTGKISRGIFRMARDR